MNRPTRSRKAYLKWYVLFAIVLCIAAYFTIPAVKAYIDRIAGVLANADVGRVVAFIRSYGAYAVAISFVLMVFQSLIAPLPAFLITFANAAVFGWWQGAILSWASAMAGAMLCFFIARALGRDAVEKIASKGVLKGVEAYFQKYGSKTILVCRLLPFVSFDAVSYFAGFTSIRFWPFVLATGLGQLPATIVYSFRRHAHRRNPVFRNRAFVHLCAQRDRCHRQGHLQRAPKSKTSARTREYPSFLSRLR